MREMAEINSNEVYTTGEAKSLLKVSASTIKRLLKRGIVRANKVGGQYRILGKELLRVVSPVTERKMVATYQVFKKNIKAKLKSW
ncbi:MAG: hypothetical protein A3I92_02875 [Candidatus Yanofskybacteria bacterium RIFCSPLOWO2_02_FULL_43_10b]|uniref:Helix-turn-helix domain-containing protein n=1 Tax=Candidatus Yanofskybacteria bacterium RIFCSPLOWO2_02_FULL_43_10b TaxID=1802704 RepID=A0A1F8H3G8_9BACT|nr:MAG: hypothetical protein A3I92_02875 [Candidatus Yanofskybacteria bacterium RIFCSPLOWO2_02_FULL_43_10b]